MGGEVLQNLQWEERPGKAYEPTSYITVAGTISKFVGYGSRPNRRATSQICSTAFSSSLISLSSIRSIHRLHRICDTYAGVSTFLRPKNCFSAGYTSSLSSI